MDLHKPQPDWLGWLIMAGIVISGIMTLIIKFSDRNNEKKDE